MPDQLMARGDRYEKMWQSLRERVEQARQGPLTEEAISTLQWIDEQMDLVWNEWRHLKHVE